MPFHSITYNDKYRFATLHNFGCTFRCKVCSYKLRSGTDGTPGMSWPRPDRFLTVEEMQTALRSVSIEKVYFMGGEPTIARELPEMLAFTKKTLGIKTYLGHTNGTQLSLPNLDGANVGLKAWRDDVHLSYTGRERRPIFDNFAAAFRAGLDLRANVVFVPGLVDIDQVEAIAVWVGTLNPLIPFHVMGYIPVPGQPYLRPTDEQMQQAVTTCRRHLQDVAASHLTSQQAVNLTERDDRFSVRRIA